jgi:ATP adenylyltransferase
MEYIQKDKKTGCVFCEALDLSDGAENLILYRARYSFVILNRYPYTSGHLMVVPYLHQASLEGLSPEIRAEIMELSVRSMRILRVVYEPQGFNLGVNIGDVAGAGVLDHVHLHVVPRWGGDTNFMTATSDVRVLPELLEDTYKRFKITWEKDKLAVKE